MELLSAYLQFVRARRHIALTAAGLLVLTSVHGVVKAADPGELRLPFESIDATVRGHGWPVTGVAGSALDLDGIAAYVVRLPTDVPTLSSTFTLEGWVALGAYPFNDAPLLQQQDSSGAGFFLGVGDRGQFSCVASLGGRAIRLESKTRIALRTWAHVACVADGSSLVLYVNGAREADADQPGPLQQATAADLLVGRNAFEMEQSVAVGLGRQQKTRILLDGIVDELRVARSAASADAVRSTHAAHSAAAPPDLPVRSLPTLPPGAAEFGAIYTRLHYYKGWDDVWRVDDAPDVVVRFDTAPYWFAFWRGTSYIPHWVTENGIWYDNEFTETFPPGMVGSAEPMSDKQCRYSQVRILESSDARAVVHWRYAPVGVGYQPAYPDPLTDWADWTDEIHTIYPDGVGVRKIVVHSSKPDADREWHEGIVVMGPGMTPADAIDPVGLTLANSAGASVDISWATGTPSKDPPQPPGGGIQRINTRSRYRPFAIARTQDDPRFDVYSGEVRRDISIYPWWNHWPTAFEPSNGRYALAADRASHSSLTHMYWKSIATTADSVTKVHLEGLSDRDVAGLASLARSWERPAHLSVTTANYTGGDYDLGERAWIVDRANASPDAALDCSLAASDASPLENAAIVVRGWGARGVAVTVDGRDAPAGASVRVGHRRRVEATDLVLFLVLRSTRPVRLVLRPR